MQEKVFSIVKGAHNGVSNSIKNKMKLWTKEQLGSYEIAKICYICKEKLENKYVKNES